MTRKTLKNVYTKQRRTRATTILIITLITITIIIMIIIIIIMIIMIIMRISSNHNYALVFRCTARRSSSRPHPAAAHARHAYTPITAQDGWNSLLFTIQGGQVSPECMVL